MHYLEEEIGCEETEVVKKLLQSPKDTDETEVTEEEDTRTESEKDEKTEVVVEEA